jgi:hypothetical protein
MQVTALKPLWFALPTAHKICGPITPLAVTEGVAEGVWASSWQWKNF